MALKKTFSTLDTFSMSSMTDIIFLLLIFFMVTSSVIFPSAMDVALPQSGEQTELKPATEVYLTKEGGLFMVEDRNDTTGRLSVLQPVLKNDLAMRLQQLHEQDSTRTIALYADSTVIYNRVVEVLDIAARNKLKMVLATKAGEQKYGVSDNATLSELPTPETE